MHAPAWMGACQDQPIMLDDVHLQILSSRGGQLIMLNSRGARVRSLPAMELPLSPTSPADGPALWRALPEPVRRSLGALHDLQAEEPVPLWLDVQAPDLAAWPWE